MGLCQYYHVRVNEFSNNAYLLSELTKKRVPKKPWIKEHESVFVKLKASLHEALSLFTLIVNKPYRY